MPRTFAWIVLAVLLCSVSSEHTDKDYRDDDYNTYPQEKSETTNPETETTPQSETAGVPSITQYDDTETQKDSQTEPETESQYYTDSETETEYETGTQYDSDPETGTQEKSETETETQYETGTETEDSETETGTQESEQTGISEPGNDYDYYEYEHDIKSSRKSKTPLQDHTHNDDNQQHKGRRKGHKPHETDDEIKIQQLIQPQVKQPTGSTLVEHALNSYTDFTKQQLETTSIIRSYKEGNLETKKFVKNLFKALAAIRNAGLTGYKGLDKPEKVVELFKRFYPKKSDRYIIRFLNHYYRGYSGAKKQYLRMKVRLMSAGDSHKEQQHQVNRRSKEPTKAVELEDSRDTSSTIPMEHISPCDKCDIMEGEEMCGANGKTYNSLCHAVNCGGLKYTHVRLGKCEDKNPCSSNTCKEDQICIPRTEGICLGLYNKEGKKVPCKQYNCIAKKRCNRSRRTAHVCGSDGRTYHSLCTLFQTKAIHLAYYGRCHPQKCTGLVCGSNGVTYESNCHAKTRSIRIDYSGKCLAEGSSKEMTCENVRNYKRCPKLPNKCKNWVIPEGSCCPVCGASLTTQVNTKALASMGNANLLHTVKKFLHQLIPKSSRDKCHMSVTSTVQGYLSIVLEPLSSSEEYKCILASTEVTDRINNPLDSDSSIIMKLGPAKYNKNKNMSEIIH